MTSAEQPEFYPQYCFHLSPTVAKWCHLRAADVVALASHPGFGGQNVFFHRNHPIQWVRVCGIVTAIDEFAGRRAYTIDDGSGATIECHVLLSEVAKSSDAITLETKPNAPAASAKIIVTTPINTGDIIDVKGTIRVYREWKQIKAEKMVLVRTTEQEVQFWEKVAKLRREVLDRPWVLDPRVVRRCRKEEEGEQRHRARKRTRSPSVAAVRTADGRPVVTGLERGVKIPRTVKAAGRATPTVTGLEKVKAKVPRPAEVEEKVLANPTVTGLERTKPKVSKPVEFSRCAVEEQQERAELCRESGTVQSRPIATGLERRAKIPRTVEAARHRGEDQATRSKDMVHATPMVTGLERATAKVPRPVEVNRRLVEEQQERAELGREAGTLQSRPIATGLERRVKPRRTADENSPWEPGTARDTSVVKPQPQPLVTGLEKGRSSVRPAEVKRHQEARLDPGQQRHAARRDNFNVAPLQPKPLITGLERGASSVRLDPGQQRHSARRDNLNVAPLQPKPLITGLEKGASSVLMTAKRPVEPVLGLQPSRSERPDPEPKALVTGLEKKHKTKTKQPILVPGQYSALGL